MIMLWAYYKGCTKHHVNRRKNLKAEQCMQNALLGEDGTPLKAEYREEVVTLAQLIKVFPILLSG